jgi:hypothetical protein
VKNIEDLWAGTKKTEAPPTRMSHHILCLMLQPVHVVEFYRFLVLASSVVGLAHRWLQ